MSDHEHFSNEVGDLFDYDVGLDEVLKNIPVEPNQNTTNETGTNGNAPVLGLDEEVKVTKQRAPIAKLDEARLVLRCTADLDTLY
jgi:replication fork protection complex subunit Csm3/Swi3